MPRVYLSDKELSAVMVIVESYLLNYPNSCTADIIRQVPERLQKCFDLQGYKKAANLKKIDG